MTTFESKHLSVRIDRSPKDVYDYARAPENGSAWAHGLSGGLTPAGDVWVGEGPSGRISVRFTPRNDFGILDHHVTVPGGAVVYVPMRVLANGSGSEVLFTVFQLPGMSKEELARDAAAVQRDLDTLKRVLETR